jgi:hypothetical protein
MKHKTTYSLSKQGCCCKTKKKENDCCKNTKVIVSKSLDNYKQPNTLEIQKQLVFTELTLIAPVIYRARFALAVPQTALVVKPPGRIIERTILYRQFLI